MMNTEAAASDRLCGFLETEVISILPSSSRDISANEAANFVFAYAGKAASGMHKLARRRMQVFFIIGNCMAWVPLSRMAFCFCGLA